MNLDGFFGADTLQLWFLVVISTLEVGIDVCHDLPLMPEWIY